MAYVGNSPGEKFSSLTQQTFSSPSGTSFVLSKSVTNNLGIVLIIDNVRQDPAGASYTAVGTSLVLSEAIASPSTMYCLYNAITVETVSPSTGSVDSSHLVAGSVDDSHISGVAASKLTGALPAISGASLTGLPTEITKSSSDPTASTNPAGGVGTVYLNTTGGEMFCLTDATAGSNVWKNIGEGRGGVPVVYTVATGGTVTTSGSYKIHTFNSSSNFIISTLGNAESVEYLVVAGGGSGGMSHGGGGGAGGYRTATGFAVTASTYAVTIGAGGAGRTGSSPGVIGSDSVFSTITSTGGGRGGEVNDDNAGDGGSGGGSGGSSGSIFAAASGNTPSTSPSQGNNGGVTTAVTSPYGGGGGGGAGAVGGDRSAGNSGAGGNGTANSISGGSVTYSGGGGASQTVQGSVAGAGGTGGGGAGGLGSSTSGTANLGGGGGGGNTGTSGAGGSGVVIIRYQFQA